MLSRKLLRNISKVNDEAAGCSSKNVTRLEQDFILGESLGYGGFGQIVKATRRTDDHECAIKIIKFESNMEDIGKYRREANNLSRLNHNNIVRYHNSWIETAQVPLSDYPNLELDSEVTLSSEICKLSENGYISNESAVDRDYDEDDEMEEDEEDSWISFEADSKQVKYLLIQMELCEKRTLRTAIDSGLYLEEAKITKYFREICEGLLHIHQNGIVHRDLKPENIFLTSRDVIKIGDFGLSKQIALACEPESPPPFDQLSFGSLTDVCGTGIYIAPELFDNSLFNIKADIYSLGVIYFEMCSRPMTVMEKSEIFPLTSKKFKGITFHKNSSKKKILIRNMLHPNYIERPTCENILKILNSEKSLGEVKEMLQQNKKVPFQQFRAFESVLRSNNVHKIDLTTSFIKKAVEIFELHGARNITVPTFLPSFGQYCDNLTTLLNVRGNSVSVSNTSRIAFAYYVQKNKIKKLRRYSVGKVFDEGYFFPTEGQECVFEALSCEPDDHVTDAEILYMTQEMCDAVFGNGNNVCFFINHRFILSTILKHYEITEEDATLFTNILIKFSKKLTTEKEFRSILSKPELNLKIKNCILKMWTPYNVNKAEEEISVKNNINYAPLTVAFRELKNIVKNAVSFGIKLENIFLSPLLITERNCSSFMFKAELNSQAVIATGDRFDSLFKSGMKMNKNEKSKPLTAIGISFNVENILKMLHSTTITTRVVDVVIYTQTKPKAIPLLKELLSRKIKCQIVTELSDFDAPSGNRPVIIVLVETDNCIVLQPKELKSSDLSGLAVDQVYTGSWKSQEFSNIFDINFPPQLSLYHKLN